MKVFIKRNPSALLGCPLCEGETGEVDGDIGKILVSRGLADCLDEPKPKAATVEKATEDLEAYREKAIRAIPESPAIAEATPPVVASSKSKPPPIKVKSKDKES